MSSGTLFLSAALAIPVEDAEQKDHVIKIFDVAVRESVQEARMASHPPIPLRIDGVDLASLRDISVLLLTENNEVQYKDCWKQCKKSGTPLDRVLMHRTSLAYMIRTLCRYRSMRILWRQTHVLPSQ